MTVNPFLQSYSHITFHAWAEAPELDFKFKLENYFVLYCNNSTATLNLSPLSREQQLCRAVLRPVVLSISESLACVIQSGEL